MEKGPAGPLAMGWSGCYQLESEDEDEEPLSKLLEEELEELPESYEEPPAPRSNELEGAGAAEA